jgi:hypothetical protein
LFKYIFGYILLGLAFLTVVIVRYAKRGLFLKKIRVTGDGLNHAERRLDEIFSRDTWNELPLLNAAYQMRTQVRFARENLEDAESFLNTGDARASGALVTAGHRLQVINGVIESGVLAYLGAPVTKTPPPEPMKPRGDSDTTGLKWN